MPDYEEKILVCVEKNCGEPFTWTPGEQRFMQSLLDAGKIDKINEPKRCLAHKQAKRARFGK